MIRSVPRAFGWWRFRKMRWAVRKAAAMTGFERSLFISDCSIDRQVRRFNRFYDLPAIIRVKSERDND